MAHSQNDSISYRRILALALPIMVSALAQNIINVTDTALLSRLNSEPIMGAAAIGGLSYLTFVMLGFGLSIGAQILIARRCGEGRPEETGRIFWHLTVILLALSLLLFVVLKICAPWLLRHMVHSDDVYRESLIYLDWRTWGLVFAQLSFAFRSLYTGISRTASLGWNTFFLALVNGIGAYALIFGKWGFPAMGIAGAGLAAVIAEGASFAYFILYSYFKLDFHKFALTRIPRYSGELLRGLFQLSLPMVLLYFVSLAGWLAFFIIIEKIGERELAISNIIRSIYLIYFIPIVSFQSVTNTLVSHLIGEGRSAELGRLLRRIIHLSLALATASALLNLCCPKLIFALYTTDDTLIREAIPTLRVVTVALLLFSVGTVLFNAVSGTGDTRASMLIEITSVGFYLIYTFVMALVLKMPVEFVWSAEWVYWTTLGCLSFWRLKSGKWRQLRI